ncbi:putative glycosyltransferase EpsJ [bioreactor metagenome]|uniref:Putative glycosyltransferase EpsJ n=1 Tax=bioreactor metagenome TaxID=1076179 RepID=A0A644T5W0_9ZZZZ|nr:glycosyltransferase family A protein [Candidatus Elulimicrobiales bacterium]
MNPKVSVIMPVYNGEKFLGEAIESVLNQTFKDFELIIVNDGSKDNSLNIIKEYGNKDNRIKIIDQINQGVSVARNIGIKKSSGEYIAFLDSDDIWVEEKLNIQLNKFGSDKELKICGTWASVIDEKGKEIKKFTYPPLEDKKIKQSSFYKHPFITSSLILKKEILEKNNLFKVGTHLAEDYEFVTKYIYNNKAKNIDKYLIKYRIHTANSSSKNLKTKLKMKLAAVKMRILATQRLIKSIF